MDSFAAAFDDGMIVQFREYVFYSQQVIVCGCQVRILFRVKIQKYDLLPVHSVFRAIYSSFGCRNRAVYIEVPSMLIDKIAEFKKASDESL